MIVPNGCITEIELITLDHMTQSNSTSSSFCRVALRLLPSIYIHLLSFGIYLHPLTSAPTPSSPPLSSPISSSLPHFATSRGKGSNSGDEGDGADNGQQRLEWPLIYAPQPQLDELHIMSLENHDISSSSSSWTNAWKNDYWGRPLSFDSSHKSWRPMAVWSFRFLKGGGLGQKVLALIGELVGRSMNPFFAFDENEVRRINDNIKTCNVEVKMEGAQQYQHQQQQHASELFVHRFINVLIHGAIVQLVGTVAMLLFRDNDANCTATTTTTTTTQQLSNFTKYISQLLFAIHPTHVECVVNAANRPHILALLFNATIVDPTSVPMVAMAVLAILGLLSAETAIFHYPAIVFTMTAIRYRELRVSRVMRNVVNKVKKTNSASSASTPSQHSTLSSSSTSSSAPPIIIKTIISLLPRCALLVLVSTTYLTYRYCNDTLSIPDGLIRPAENPFYDKAYNLRHTPHSWTWTWRLINYSYILSLHIMKSFGVEMVGYSHEYGYDCIPEMRSLRDWRLVLPMMLTLLFGWIVAWSLHGRGWKEEATRTSLGDNGSDEEDTMLWKKERKVIRDEDTTERVLQCLVFLSWMATLFPIAGILKVGTFVADRIVVASTFGTCIFVGRLFALGIVGSDSSSRNSNDGKKQKAITTIISYVILLCLSMHHLASQTHQRASEWMDSVPLLESSLKSCPRSIKSNLEMSKLYSGLVPHMLDLEKAL